jgi:hypothetical protein
VIGMLGEHSRLQDHLGQLFDEQRNTVSLRHDLLNDFKGQGLSCTDLLDHQLGLLAGEAVHSKHGQIRTRSPWRTKRGTCDQQHQESGSRGLVQQQRRQLQGGWIDPVHIFDDKQNGALGGHR